jgi:hypothetical protein
MLGTRLSQVLTLALALAPLPVLGQAPEDKWSVQAELGFNGASGNSSFSILRTGLTATHLTTDVAEFEASVLVRYGRSEGTVIADDRKASLKLDVWPQTRLSPFVFADGSLDRARRLDLRLSAGAGAKWTFWRGSSGKASVSAAALFDRQDFAESDSLGVTAPRNLARWSLRTKVERKLSATISLEQVAFWQPVWDDAGDYLVDVTTSLSARLQSRLTLAIEHQYMRDAAPPAGVEPSDQRFSVVLTIEL